MAKSFLTEYRLELSTLLSLVFGFLTIVGLAGFLKLSVLKELAQPFGAWTSWIAVIAPLGLIVCLWWLYDYISKTRKLAKLIETPSKAKFVKNLDDIEYLAWTLPQKFETRVLEKKKELRI